MVFMLALGTNFTAGPATLTSLCGITSLLPTSRWTPLLSVTVCDALYAPLSTDHAWHPRVSWRMMRTGPLIWVLAGAAKTSEAPARARTDIVRFMRLLSFPAAWRHASR